jgi:hypothetical protein
MVKPNKSSFIFKIISLHYEHPPRQLEEQAAELYQKVKTNSQGI